jgi:hypothetical protein
MHTQMVDTDKGVSTDSLISTYPSQLPEEIMPSKLRHHWYCEQQQQQRQHDNEQQVILRGGLYQHQD